MEYAPYVPPGLQSTRNPNVPEESYSFMNNLGKSGSTSVREAISELSEIFSAWWDKNKHTPLDYERSGQNIMREFEGLPLLPVHELSSLGRIEKIFGAGSNVVRLIRKLLSLTGEDVTIYIIGAMLAYLGLHVLYNYLFTIGTDIIPKQNQPYRREAQIDPNFVPLNEATIRIQPITGMTQTPGARQMSARQIQDRTPWAPISGPRRQETDPPKIIPDIKELEPPKPLPYGHEEVVLVPLPLVKEPEQLAPIPTTIRAEIDDTIRLLVKPKHRKIVTIDNTKQIQRNMFDRMEAKINSPEFFDYQDNERILFRSIMRRGYIM